MSRIKKLQDRQAALVQAMRALSHTAAEEERQFTEEEQQQYDQHKAELAEVKTDLAREQELQALERGLTPVDDLCQATPEETQAQTGRQPDPQPAWRDDPNCGFRDPREFLTLVMDAGQNGRVEDPRLQYLATAGSDEAGGYADPYGGFLLPAGFSPNLLSVAAEADPIAGRTTNVPMEVAVLDIPARVDKDHSDSVSGGLRVYRRAEGDTSSSSRMELEQVTMRAHALFGLAYATEELLARSPISFVALLEAGFRDEFAAKLIAERLSGTGVGMMEGVLNTPCVIEVAKEAGQAADTIVYENVVNMRARCWRYGQAIWLANHDTLPQLMQMTIDVGTGGSAVWQPSARETEPDLLLGRPIFFTEFCETVGDAGDLLLGNWSQYLEGVLTPAQQAESIHVRFVYHERTFKFWLENDGRCWWRSALTPRNGSTLSPFVKLAART